MKLLFVIEAFVYLLFYVHVVFLSATFIAAKAFKIQVREVSLFNGRIKKVYRLFGTPVIRRKTPINSSITFLLKKDLSSGSVSRIGSQKALDEASRVEQAIVALAPLVGLSIIAVLIMGPTSFGQHVYAGIGQIVIGGLNPCTAGSAYVDKFFRIHDASILLAFATLATKQIAFAVFPLYGTPLHALVNWPLQAVLSGSLAARISHGVGIAFIFMAMIAMCGWVLALVAHAAPSIVVSLCNGPAVG